MLVGLVVADVFWSVVVGGWWCSRRGGGGMLKSGRWALRGCKEIGLDDAEACWSNRIWITGCFRWYLIDLGFWELRYYVCSSSLIVIHKLRFWQELIPVLGSSLCGSCCRSNRVILGITCSSRDLVLVLLPELMCPILHIWSYVPVLSLVTTSVAVKTCFLIILLVIFSITWIDVVAAMFREQQNVDFKKVDAHVHQLKGSSSSIGAQRVKNVCVAFRNSCEDRNIQECLRCLQAVKHEYLLVKSKLESMFRLEQQIVAAGGSIPMVE